MLKKRKATSKRTFSGRARISRSEQQTWQQLDRLVELRRRREWLADAVPGEITTERIDGPGGTPIYSFTHQHLGLLGRLHIRPVPFSQGIASIDVEMVETDPQTDTQWNEKYTVFKTIVDLCIAALPGSRPGQSPLPPLEEARKRRILYHRFLDAGSSLEMFALAKSLTREEYEMLVASASVAQHTSVPAPGAMYLDPIAIKQRLDELQVSWNDLQHRPVVEE